MKTSAIGLSRQNFFSEFFEDDLKDERLNIGAFHLHQVTEALYTALLLIYIHYKPKTHNLRKLSEKSMQIDPGLFHTFPGNSKQEKDEFGLLTGAYIDARYKKSYRITVETLENLRNRIKLLEKKIKELCEKKMEEMQVK